MRKVGALLHNEIIKLLKRKSIIVVSIIMIALMALVGIVIAFLNSDALSELNFDYYKTISENVEGEYNELEVQAAKEIFEHKESDASYPYMSTAYNNVSNLSKYIYDEDPDYLFSDNDIAKFTDICNKFIKSIKEKDYKLFLDTNYNLCVLYEYSEESLKAEREMNELLLKYCPDGKDNGSYTTILERLKNQKLALEKNVSYNYIMYSDSDSDTPPLLSTEEREYIEKMIAIEMYALENDIIESSIISGVITGKFNFSFTQVANILSSVGFALIQVLMLILAGGIISDEIASGSIKSLIIAPVKRWKIVFAKFLALLIISFSLTFIMLTVTTIVCGLTFGFESTPIICYINGGVRTISPLVSLLGSSFSNYISTLFLIFFALTLSSLVKKSSISIGLSISVLYLGSIVRTVIAAIFPAEVLMFLPSSNLNLYDKITRFTENTSFELISDPSSTSLGFSAVYIVVLCIIMALTMHDAFKNRDI